MTEESGQNIKPLLELDSEGRIWMAWERNQGDDHTIYTRVYDGNGWSPEMVAMDYRNKESFDMAADGEGKVWIGWNAVCFDREPPTIIAGASYYWKGEWHSVGPDTIDVYQHQIHPWHVGSAKIFFHSGSLRMVMSSTPPISYDLNTQTLEKLIYNSLVFDESSYGPICSLSQVGDENIWVLFNLTRWYNMPVMGYTDLLSIAYFFSNSRWTSLKIDEGAYFMDFDLLRYVSAKSLGSNAKDKVYVICAVDENPVTQITQMEDFPYYETTHLLKAHLEVRSFDATTGDSLSHWNLSDVEPSVGLFVDGIEVATTDESEIVGFAISRNGDTSLRALMDPVWYKPVSLEGDSTVTSQHPSTVVDNLGTIWVAWDDGKDVYLSSVRISDMEVDDAVTSVESDAEDRAAAPAKFHLASNYPNPFNAATSIGLSIPFETTGTLAIYDVLGQQVRTLLSGDLKIGEHSIVWDGRDEAGRNVASGVYLYRLTLDGKEMTETKKMVLIR